MLKRLFLAMWLLCFASSALADARVIVLGMRSVEGDDELANQLTEQLRGAARSVPGWSVSPTAVSMAQMSLAHGCDELDAACLLEIAKGLQVERIVYGTLRRTSTRTDHGYGVSLSLFDADTGEISRQIDDTFEANETDVNSLANRAERLVRRLVSVAAGGAIAVQANVPDAQVRINGQDVGQTHDGALRLEGLQPGQYRIEITREGYVPHVSTVSVIEGNDTSLAAVLSQAGSTPTGGATDDNYGDEPYRRRHDYRVPGWILVGTSVLAAGGAIFSMVKISDVNSDPLYEDYRDRVARGNENLRDLNRPDEMVDDVCEAADSGFSYELEQDQFKRVTELCSKGATFEVLQWVFGISAIATGTVGVILLLSSDNYAEDDEATAKLKAPQLSLRPRVGVDHASVTATLRF